GHCRLADVATKSTAVFFERCGKAAQAAYPDEGKQLLARIREVLAQMGVERDSFALQLALQDLGHQRRATAAGCGGSGRFLAWSRGRAARLHGATHLSLAAVV